MKIIKTSEALPKSGRYVLAWLEGAKIPMRAMWAAQHTLPLGDDADPEWGEYSEEKDEYFCPAGWYEMNQHEEQHWGVDGNVVAWCELPRLDHQCLAQIEEPAQPIAGYRISDPSDPTIKPWLSDTPDDNGYTSEPLYAGAAPAAVAWPANDLEELAMLNKLIELGAKASYANAQSNSDDGRAGAEADDRWRKLRSEMGELIRAHKAPALEAPAAQDLPADEFRGDTPSLVRNIIALLELDVEGALVPHGVGGHARGLLSAAAARLAASPQAPAAPILGDAERLAAARQDKSLADYWRNRVAGLAEEFTTAEAALYLADRIVADLYDLPQAGVARPAAPAAPAVDALDSDRWRALEGQMDAGRVSLTVHHTEAEQWDGRTISDAGELQDYADSLAAQAAAKGEHGNG
ncbi:hypothetical protein EZI45_20925 [Delftia tsuruhatensis]|uniref:hypothetical protein n=1 Tax=Delftia tsuruhatensis TaxID=180282 RepID=UPI001055B60F|nr:hypothetical protein [Delftia tsuruhatensis]TDF24601.1 hypothetical protein EZI45_20925 [Delftia tsuruhatensis]